MNLTNIPWTPIIFLATQAIVFVLWLISIGKKVDANEKELSLIKQANDDLKKENAEIKKELRDMMVILVKVQQNTDLLMLGRIKTGARNE